MAVPQKASSPESEPSAQVVADLVSANHILYDQQVVDAFGHVSVRHDRRPDRFLLARNMAPGQVGRDDILQFNLSGESEDAQGRRVYLERFLHASIYRHWPQVQAIVHSHSSTIVPLTVVPGVSLRAVFHMAGFIGTSAPVFDISDVAGDDSNLLISDSRLGAAFAAHFSDNDIVLMRGHGSTVVADSLQKVVFRAVYAERNARIQSAAMGMGDVRYLSIGECAACRDSHEAQVDRPWSLWKDEALRSRTPRDASAKG
jgi:ribulose-5-phosphate 4-epimerase/fuculose-1-phosphate aldolase